jgi:hypothetical protein
MRIVITQSNYVPWRGWFALVRSAELLVIYDSAQYTKRDWRNRNLIWTPHGERWLTIPVNTRGKFDQTIHETTVTDRSWTKSHFGIVSTTANFYHSDPSIVADFRDLFSKLGDFDRLSAINLYSTQWIAERIGLKVRILSDTQFDFSGSPSKRLADIAHTAGASVYITGSAARNYLDPTEFQRRQIEIKWIDYSELPADDTLPSSSIELSIIDTILRHGYERSRFLSTFLS